MELDIGEYFVVEHGRMTQPGMDTPFGARPPQYDNSYDGVVFKLLAQEHTMMAVEVVFPKELEGYTASIDSKGLSIMPVTQCYVDALRGGVQFHVQTPPTLTEPLKKELPTNLKIYLGENKGNSEEN